MYVWPNGESYDGDYVNDVKEGRGVQNLHLYFVGQVEIPMKVSSRMVKDMELGFVDILTDRIMLVTLYMVPLYVGW